MENTDTLSREEALQLLQVKAATLYAYVSRGLLRSVKSRDHGRSQYSREDVLRLAARKRGATSRAGAASGSMRWGEPVVSTSITSIGALGPVYRNRPALELARSGVSFETVVHLLLTGVWRPIHAAWPLQPTPPDARARIRRPGDVRSEADMAKLLACAVLSLGLHDRGDIDLSGDTTPTARAIMQMLAGCLGWFSRHRAFVERRQDETIAELVLRATDGRRDAKAQAVLDSALVLLADHELAAASFAARVAASTNSDLYNCVAAAICAHAGSSASAAAHHVDQQLFGPLTARNADALLALVRTRGASLFGFNHPLYPHGDPRAEAILALVASLDCADPKVRRFLHLLQRGRTEAGAHPGLAVALIALTRALEMPASSAGALWIVSRAAGWIAHALEQRTQAFMLRPRAKYVV